MQKEKYRQYKRKNQRPKKTLQRNLVEEKHAE